MLLADRSVSVARDRARSNSVRRACRVVGWPAPGMRRCDDARDAAGIRAKNNAARVEAGGVGGLWAALESEGRWRTEEVEVGVGVEEVVVAAVQVLVEAMDLIAVASLEEVEHVMDEVVDLHDGIVAETGQRERLRGGVLSGHGH